MKALMNCGLLVSVLLLTTLLILSGCKKDKEDPIKKKYVWAVGSADSTGYGTIYFSDNGGDHWVRQGEGAASIQGVNLFDVWAVDENTVWAVGDNNVIIKTMDGGITWNRIAAPSKRSEVELTSISIINATNIWISGSGGTVYNSKDGGNSWNSVHSDVLVNNYLQGIHAIDPNIIYVTGGPIMNSTGFIARTIDAGITWDSIVPANNFNKNRWIGVTSSNASNIVIYGGRSHYIYSTDGGHSWTNDSIEGTGGTGGADINCLKMLDSQTWWGAFDYDGIFETKDAGDNWLSQGSAPGPKGMWLFGIDYYDHQLCVIVGESSMSNTGKIIKTANGGQLWELKLETHAQMHKVSFIK